MRMLVDGKQFAVNDKLELSQQEATKGLFDGVEQPKGKVLVDDASVVIKEDGKTYRLPKNDSYKEFGRIFNGFGNNTFVKISLSFDFGLKLRI